MTHKEEARSGRATADHADLDGWPPDWDEFTHARSRFFAGLARDAAIRRLERAMRTPIPTAAAERALDD